MSLLVSIGTGKKNLILVNACGDETQGECGMCEDYAAIFVKSLFTSTWAKITSGSRCRAS
jgi:hypothetical protein